MEYVHEIALEEALTWVKRNFNVTGIIVSGSIIRGNPDKNSDFDIYVLHENLFRQRIQKYFNNVPCELLINNVTHVYEYFEKEFLANRPVSAHIVATGEIVFGRDNPEITRLRSIASEYLSKTPELTEKQLVSYKYRISNLFEDAVDTVNDMATCNYFMNKTMDEIVNWVYLMAKEPLPRTKERMHRLEQNHGDTGRQIVDFFNEESFLKRFEVLRMIVQRTIGQEGFFEWDSGSE